MHAAVMQALETRSGSDSRRVRGPGKLYLQQADRYNRMSKWPT